MRGDSTRDWRSKGKKVVPIGVGHRQHEDESDAVAALHSGMSAAVKGSKVPEEARLDELVVDHPSQSALLLDRLHPSCRLDQRHLSPRREFPDCANDYCGCSHTGFGMEIWKLEASRFQETC